jgi:hypothetical protein
MKIYFSFFLLFLGVTSFGQELPTDSILIEKVYGKCDSKSESFTRKHNEDEFQHPYFENITYRIKHKEIVNLNDKELLLLITEAPFIYQHGHVLGYMDIHYLEKINNDWKLINSIISEKPLGDESNYEILIIGINKLALTSIFQSSGNRHFEKTISFYYLQLSESNLLFKMTLEYDNLISKQPDSETAECEAEKHQSSFEIIESENEWFDIKENRTNYILSKGCENEKVESEYEILYSYDRGKYIEKQKLKIK